LGQVVPFGTADNGHYQPWLFGMLGAKKPHPSRQKPTLTSLDITRIMSSCPKVYATCLVSSRNLPGRSPVRPQGLPKAKAVQSERLEHKRPPGQTAPALPNCRERLGGFPELVEECTEKKPSSSSTSMWPQLSGAPKLPGAPYSRTNFDKSKRGRLEQVHRTPNCRGAVY